MTMVLLSTGTMSSLDQGGKPCLLLSKNCVAFLPRRKPVLRQQLPIPIGVMIAGDDAVIMRHQVEANAAYFGVQPIVLEGVAHDLMLVSHLIVCVRACAEARICA